MEDEQEEPSITIKGDQPVSFFLSHSLSAAHSNIFYMYLKLSASTAEPHQDKCRLMGLFAPRVDFIPNY